MSCLREQNLARHPAWCQRPCPNKPHNGHDLNRAWNASRSNDANQLSTDEQEKAPMMNRKLIAALVAVGLALPAVTRAQDAPIEEQIVNQMNKVFGVHAGFRANHAKGVVAEGKFKASLEAAGLSKAV